jgi:hypothetical protein
VARANDVPSRELLHGGLGECAAVLDLLAHGDATTEEVSDGGRVRVAVLREKQVGRRLKAV